MNPLDVLVRVSAHLELEALKALGLATLGVLGGVLGRGQEDPVVRGHPLPHGATEQVADPHPECLARGVPTGDVDGSLGVEVSHEVGVHRGVDPADLGRIEAE